MQRWPQKRRQERSSRYITKYHDCNYTLSQDDLS